MSVPRPGPSSTRRRRSGDPRCIQATTHQIPTICRVAVAAAAGELEFQRGQTKPFDQLHPSSCPSRHMQPRRRAL